MRHFVIVGVLIALVTPLIYLGIAANNVMPVQASAQALPVDWMWNMDAAAIAFLFSLIMVPLIYSLFVFRRRKGDTGDAEHTEGNTRLEVTWTVVPLIRGHRLCLPWSLHPWRNADRESGRHRDPA